MLVLEASKATEIVGILADDYSRKICLSIVEKSLSVDEISKEQCVPVSTCYRRIQELQEYGLVRADKTSIEDGKKLVRYRATFKAFSISFQSGRLEVDMVQNEDTSNRLNEMWSAMREPAKQQVNAATLEIA